MYAGESGCRIWKKDDLSFKWVDQLIREVSQVERCTEDCPFLVRDRNLRVRNRIGTFMV